MKPELKYEAGVLSVVAQVNKSVDADADGKPSLKLVVSADLQVDAYEAVTEIAKKDLPLIKLVLENLKLSL